MVNAPVVYNGLPVAAITLSTPSFPQRSNWELINKSRADYRPVRDPNNAMAALSCVIAAIYTASRAVTNPSHVFHTYSGDSKVSRRIRDP